MSQSSQRLQQFAAALASATFLSACGGGDAQPPTIVSAAAAPTPAPIAPAPSPTPTPSPAPSPTPTPSPAPSASGTVLTTFDETTPLVVTNFGGAGYSIEAGPAGGSAH